jgi:hypothetical protein
VWYNGNENILRKETLMTAFSLLHPLSGNWQGTYTLQDPNNNHLPVDSPSTATVTPILGGRFVRFDYTWVYNNQPQEGSILFGHEGDSDTTIAHWIDSWHMGDKVLVSRTTGDNSKMVNVLGYWSVPPGPDWGWRTTVEPTFAPDSFRMAMYIVTPEGEEALALAVTYQRT